MQKYNIVLLILAGVTIQTLTGDNGLLNKALDAKQTSNEAEIRERIQLAVTATKTNNLGELNKESIEEELTKEFVDELNTYVNNYNEEHKNDEDFVKLNRWKYNEGNYPTFE